MKIRANVGSRERIVSMTGGVVLGMLAAKAHRGKGRSLALSSAAALLGRGVFGYCPVNAAVGRGRSDRDTREALAGNRGVKVIESVTIRSDAGALYDTWRRLDNLPMFMGHLERVDVLDARTSHWVMRGPAGVRFEWDAEIINEIRPMLIAWRSLPGAEVVSAGSVQFRERQRRAGLTTEVTVTMQYEPFGGKASAMLAWLVGQSPASMLREDLRRFKAQIEAREVPTTAARSHGPRSIVGGVARVDG
jgi:uncharacterized membrane protein